MIPLHDENPTRRFPIVTVALIIANLAVFVYQVSLPDAQLLSFFTTWSFVPARYFANPLAPLQIATIFSAMFMHTGWVHISGNMLYLWIFGNNIEDRLGRSRFVLFYLLCGVAAAALQGAVAPASTVPTLGASGAIAGVLGAYLLLYPGTAVVTLIPIFFFFEIARIPAFLVIGFWFVLQLGNGLASLSPAVAQAGGVAWFAHIGGFATGFVLATPLWAKDRWSRHQTARRY